MTRRPPPKIHDGAAFTAWLRMERLCAQSAQLCELAKHPQRWHIRDRARQLRLHRMRPRLEARHLRRVEQSIAIYDALPEVPA